MRSSPRRWIAVTLLGLSLAGCSTTMTGRKQLTLISESRMTEIGLATFSSLKAKGTLSDDTMLNEYVACVSTAIVDVVPEAYVPVGGKWEALVFDNPAPNAFALPGGKIGVNTGMLEVATTSGQLAAVIGHEVAHVILRHGNERMSQSMLVEKATRVRSLAIGAAAPGMERLVGGGLGLAAEFGFLLPFSRKHEHEADEVGQMFMAQAGFYPAEAVTLWQSMAAAPEAQSTAQWKSTHPTDETRISRLQENLPRAMTEYEHARKSGKDPLCVPPVVYE